MMYGYARVSTDGQDTALQLAALKRAGVKCVVQETRSGVLHLHALEQLLAKLKQGDQLVVFKVDRLSRSLRGLLDVHEFIAKKGASLRSLTEPIDTGTPVGLAFFQLLGVFAQLERSLIRERCMAGRREALERGVKMGKPRSFDYDKARELRLRGWTYPQIAEAVGSHRATVAHALTRNGLVPFVPRKRRKPET